MDLKETIEQGLSSASNLAKDVRGAATDPQFQQDVVRNVRRLGLVPERSPYGVGSIPSESDLAKMPWADLIALRKKLTSREDQNAVAPYEHRAYAREFSPDLYSAAQNAIGSFGYTPFKSITGGSRSDPSWSEIGQGLLGVLEAQTK